MFLVIFYYIRGMKEYATSRVANLLPYLGYRFIHALEASPVHRRQTFQGKALQVNLRGLDRRMPQQLADHLDRYVLFLQGRGERVTDRVRGDRLTHTTSLRQRPQVAVKAQQGAVVFRIAPPHPFSSRSETGTGKASPCPCKPPTLPTRAVHRPGSPPG